MKKIAVCLLFAIVLQFIPNLVYCESLSVKDAYQEYLTESNCNSNNQYITRSGFITVLMKMLGYTNDIYTSSFIDISPNSWCYKYISNAQRRKIASGDSFGAFNPNRNITVEEAIIFCSTAFNINQMIYEKSDTDDVGASNYAKKYVEYAQHKGLYPLNYRANQHINANDALTLISKFINLKEKSFETVSILSGYPKMIESESNNNIKVLIKTNSACKIYYLIADASKINSAPKIKDLTSYFGEIKNTNGEVSSLIKLEKNKRYNIYFVAKTQNGESSRIYTLTNVMLSPFTYGDGTQNNPYQIYTKYQLDQVKYNLDKCYKLCADIIYNGSWTPIGIGENQNEMFSGTIDGQGHMIYGLKINGTDKVGFISSLYGGVVKNIYIDANVSGKNICGIICGESQGGRIENCSVSGNVSACGNISGGIVGKNNGLINNCVSVNYSVTSVSYSGGIAGQNQGDIKNTISTGGYIISDMYASGISALNIGGLVENCVAAAGTAIDTITNVSGRITTNRNNGRTKNNYVYSEMVSGDNVDIGHNTQDGENVSWDNLQSDTFYKTKFGWDFKNMWEISSKPNFLLPTLRKNTKFRLTQGLFEFAPLGISNYSQLVSINNNSNGHYILLNDIKLENDWKSICIPENEESFEKAFSGTLNGNGYSIYGLNSSLFDTVYGGCVRNLNLKNYKSNNNTKSSVICVNNYGTISNCNTFGEITSNTTGDINLIGGICVLNYGNIYNSKSDIIFTDNSTHSTIGGISAQNEGFIEGCTSTGKIKSLSNIDTSNTVIGGIVGENYSGYVYSSVSNLQIDAQTKTNYCGGICGIINGGEIYKCASFGNIKAIYDNDIADVVYIGGICGLFANGLLMNCYSIDNISSKSQESYCGGICGFLEYGTLSNSYTLNTINQTVVKLQKGFSGGIIGYCQAGYVETNVAINPYILTNGKYAPICAENIDGAFNANYYYKNISSKSAVSKSGIAGNSATINELTNSDFYFKAISAGGKLGWLGGQKDNVWTFEKTKNNIFPYLKNVNNQLNNKINYNFK